MGSLKQWFVETWGPSAVRGLVLGGMGVLVSHGTELAKFGIVTDSVAHTTTIHWTTLEDVIIPIVVAIAAGFVKTGHVALTNTITGGQK